MKQELFAVLDVVAKTYGQPIPYRNQYEATRAWDDIVNDPKPNQYNAHPEDFILVKIGYYDTDLGTLVPAPIEHVSSAKAVKKSTSPQQLEMVQ